MSGGGYIQNGFVIPPKGKRKHYTSHMDFSSYCKLCSFLVHHEQSPTKVVTQHDDDKVTYRQGFQEIERLKHASETNLRLISNLIALLYSKGVITQTEQLNMIKATKGSL